MAKKTSLLLVAAAVALLPGATADGQYRSRPDLAPPRLNITIPAPDATGTEYVFVAPYSFTGTTERPGAYIYRKDGDLVWASTGYYGGGAFNFHPTTYQGKTVLQGFQGGIDAFHGMGYGQHVLLDHRYQHVVTAVAANHRISSMHEFNLVRDGETALIEIFSPIPSNLTVYGGNSSQQWIGNGLFQEFNVRTGDLVFEWNALDHLDPADSLNPLGQSPAQSGLSSASAWDFVHINSVDKDEQGNYLVSSRHMSAIYKINGTDGSIIWTLGGKHPSFTQVGNWTFGFQHHARWRSQSSDGTTEVISFFDNSGDGELNFNNVSRALVVQLNQTDYTATIVRKATAPYNILAVSQGNAQLLPNDHIFVNWGSAGAYSEFDGENKVIYHAFLEDLQNYRGFAAKWTGAPTEDPALVAVKTSLDSVQFYVSWNGDTETKRWEFYAADTDQLISTVDRKSFETGLTWNFTTALSLGASFYAQAIGADGQILAQSKPVTLIPDISLVA